MNTTKSMGTPGKRRKIQKNKQYVGSECYVSPVVVQKESKMKSEIIPVKFIKRKAEEQQGVVKCEEPCSKPEEIARDCSNVLKVRY